MPHLPSIARAVTEMRPEHNTRGTVDAVNDFLIKELGPAVPFGIYDITANAGLVGAGLDPDGLLIDLGLDKPCQVS